MDGLGFDGSEDAAAVVVSLPAEVVELIARRAAELVAEQRGYEAARSALLTIPEAADLLRCRRHRIDDLLCQRRLTRYKDGSRTLVRRDEVEAYIGLTAPRRVNGRT
jgi:excisionase family DNA binding protein